MRSEVIVRLLSGAIVRRRLRRHLYTIDGLHHLPAQGSFVLAPNHRSYFDHFVMELVVGAAVGRPVWFLTKQESFTSYVSRLWTRAWYGIPVDRDRPTPETLRAVQRVFASSEVLCVYPEGTRNAGDTLLPFKAGAFRFALSGDAPVIPVAMIGGETVLPKGRRTFRPEGRVHVVFGQPLAPSAKTGKQAAAQELATLTETAINELLNVAECNAREPRRPALVSRVAQGLDHLITEALSADGRLDRADQHRLEFVASLLGRMEARPHHIEVQRIRLRALAVARLPRLLQVFPALSIRRRLNRILIADPEHPVANYLLARWCLAMPVALGGGRDRAEAAFETSVRTAEPSDTRALAGLAEIQRADGRIGAARANLAHVAAAPFRPGSREEMRAARARDDLLALDARAQGASFKP